MAVEVGIPSERSQSPMAAPPRLAKARSVRVAVAVLALCCVCWGLSFPAMQICSTAFERDMRQAMGPAGGLSDTWMKLASSTTFIGWRFALAAGVYAVLTCHRQRGYRREDWASGLLVGGFLGGGMFLQIIGLRFTLPSVSAFLTCLTVVFAPLGQALILRRRVGWATWAAVGVSLIGFAVLSRSNPDAEVAKTLVARPPVVLFGEVLTVLSAVVFTAQILAVDRCGRRADPTRMTTIAMATTGLLNIVGGLALGGQGFYGGQGFAILIRDWPFLWSMACLVLFSSALALHLMNIYQPRVSPAAASVIYCLEPIFATAFSVILGTERLTGITVAGGAMVLLAVLIVIRAAAAQRDSATG